jgi:hypothetical protein
VRRIPQIHVMSPTPKIAHNPVFCLLLIFKFQIRSTGSIQIRKSWTDETAAHATIKAPSLRHVSSFCSLQAMSKRRKNPTMGVHVKTMAKVKTIP